MNHAFWLYHADAFGVAVIAAGLIALVWLWLDHRHQHALRAQRAADRAIRAAERKRLHAHYQNLFAAISGRSKLDETVTEAIALTQPAWTPLTDSYVNTVADVPSPYAPAFYAGGVA